MSKTKIDNNFGSDLNALTRRLTAFNSFNDLLDSHPQYRPTILPRDWMHVDLADAYDAAQGARGDKRRAWRGTGPQDYSAPASPEGYLSVRLGGVPAGSGLYSEWLRVIHAINKTATGDDLPIGTPTESYNDGNDDTWVEEYPEFRVILGYTLWGQAANYGVIQAKTAEASVLLAKALEAVR